MTKDPKAQDFDARVRADLIDSMDEEVEMEIDDDRLDKLIDAITEQPETATSSAPATSRSCSGCSASSSGCRTT